jgi:cytosine permease
VSASDVIFGLALGNLLAVLSWALMCAPIAVRERLTVYWQIRKIAGPYLTVLYSATLAIVLCMLAGSMVNVSTTAITLPMGIESPNFAAGESLPSLPWALVAVVVGSVIAVLAILGFSRIAHFAKVCAPWMPLVFIAGAISCLPMLGVKGFGDLWQVANEKYGRASQQRDN